MLQHTLTFIVTIHWGRATTREVWVFGMVDTCITIPCFRFHANQCTQTWCCNSSAHHTNPHCTKHDHLLRQEGSCIVSNPAVTRDSDFICTLLIQLLVYIPSTLNHIGTQWKANWEDAMQHSCHHNNYLDELMWKEGHGRSAVLPSIRYCHSISSVISPTQSLLSFIILSFPLLWCFSVFIRTHFLPVSEKFQSQSMVA